MSHFNVQFFFITGYKLLFCLFINQKSQFFAFINTCQCNVAADALIQQQAFLFTVTWNQCDSIFHCCFTVSDMFFLSFQYGFTTINMVHTCNRINKFCLSMSLKTCDSNDLIFMDFYIDRLSIRGKGVIFQFKNHFTFFSFFRMWWKDIL